MALGAFIFGAILSAIAGVLTFIRGQRRAAASLDTKAEKYLLLGSYAAFIIFAMCAAVEANAAPLPKRCAALLPEMKTAYRRHPIMPAALAAQVMQESACRPLARSPVGALGLTQFTPPTIREMKVRHGIVCDWRKPPCALEMQAAYMLQLYKAKTAREMLTRCDRWATAAAAYNSGLGWQNRNRRATAKAGGNPRRYWGKHDGIQKYHDPRWADWAAKENTEYPHRIIKHQHKFTPRGMKGEC